MSPTRRSDRGRRRGLVVALVVGLLLAACSDAHTEEEKAWADDGIDPQATFVVVPARLAAMARSLVAAYQQTHAHAGTFYYALVDDDSDTQARIEDLAAAGVWIGPSDLLEGTDPELQLLFGWDPLAAVSVEDGLAQLPSWDALAGHGDETVGLCDESDPCGEATDSVLAAAGVEPEPTLEGSPDEVIEALREGEVKLGIVPRSYGVAAFPRVSNSPLPPPDDGRREQVIATYGDSAITADFATWVQQGLPLLAPTIMTQSGILAATST